MPSSESSRSIENGISMQENLLWDRFCATGSPAKNVNFWYGRHFLTKMCPNQEFWDALSKGNIRD